MSTVLTEEGKITIPQTIRDLLGIVPGSQIDFEVLEDGRIAMVVDPALRAQSRFRKYAGSLKTGMSTDEMMAELRGEE